MTVEMVQPGTAGGARRAGGPRSTLLELREVTKRYEQAGGEVAALVGVSLAVAAGELVAVMGPSGSGKSTLLHVAGGLEAPSRGSVRIGLNELATLTTAELATVRRRQVGYVFQRWPGVRPST